MMTNQSVLNPEHSDETRLDADLTEAMSQVMDDPKTRARPVPRITIQAFCEDHSTADVLLNVAADRRLSKTHVHVQMGGLQAAVSFYQTASTPNLVIIESLQESKHLIQDLDRLAEVCDSGTKVIILGRTNDVMLYRELLRRGVSEYLVAPVLPIQIMESISNLYNNPDKKHLGHVIAFVGAKGGVGSSAICHNIAWAMSEILKTDVVIADLDLAFGTAGLDFNQDPVQGILDALSSPDRLDEVLLDRLLSKCSEHLSLFAAPGTLEREYDLDVKGCLSVLDVMRDNIPYALLDLPHVWTGWAKQMMLQADEIVITASPDLANLRNTKNLVELLRSARSNDNLPWLILNQVNMPKRPEISARDFAQAVNLNPAAVIDFDAELFGMAANNGQMIDELSKKSRVSEQFRELSFLLTRRKEHKVETSKSFLQPLMSKMKFR